MASEPDQVASEPDQVALEPDQVAMDPGAEQDQEGCQVGFQEGTAVLPGGKGVSVRRAERVERI